MDKFGSREVPNKRLFGRTKLIRDFCDTLRGGGPETSVVDGRCVRQRGRTVSCGHTDVRNRVGGGRGDLRILRKSQ